MMAKVGFIGLGVMGYPMAGHIRQRGNHELVVYNRTAGKAKQWVSEFGGNWTLTASEAAYDCDFVFACVGNDDNLRSITTGPHGAFCSMRKDAIFIDHTTASATLARQLANTANERGFHFLDAPISGGQAGAREGVLTVMVGGECSIFDRAKPIMDCYAKMVGLMGPSGTGQLTKMVNQISTAGLVQSLAEAIGFAQNAGLDVEKVISVISKGAAQSWQMENRWQTMNESQYEHGFAVDWMRKDLKICMTEARRNHTHLPLTALVDKFYAEIQQMGGGRWDTSSLLLRLKNASQNLKTDKP